MSKPLGQLPFFERLEQAQTVILAGAGGVFDFFCALPLYHALKTAGKTVYLANLSFSDLQSATGETLAPDLMKVTADTLGNERYFCSSGRGHRFVNAWG